MDYSIKDELHKLIDTCNEEAVLYEIKQKLSGNEKDWWDELTEEDKERIFESERQIASGQFYTQEQVHEMMQQWKKNSDFKKRC